MHLFPENGARRVPFLIFAILTGLALLVIFFRYLFTAFLPFLIAFCIALLLKKPTDLLVSHTKLPRRLVSSLLALLFTLGLLAGAGALLWKLIYEIGAFTRSVLSGENPLLQNLEGLIRYFEAFFEKLPFSGGENGSTLRDMAAGAFLDLVKNLLSELGTRLPSMAGAIASAIPEVLLFGVVTILSAVYFSADLHRIRSFFHRAIPQKWNEALCKWSSAAGKSLGNLLRSYAILFLFTFAELLLGFLLLREPYAFLLAILTALVDSLPIFGTGTVLVPMALYRFFTGDPSAAIGFCILYLVITAVRQIAEPKILGAGAGIHPLLMLLSMYLGLRLFGAVGMILLPPLAITLKGILSAWREQKEAAS